MIPLLAGDSARAFLSRLSQEDAADEAAARARAQAVADILADVRARGDDALRDLAQRFGDAPPTSLAGDDPQVTSAAERLTPEARTALTFAAERIRHFAQAVKAAAAPVTIDGPELSVGLRWRPVARAACYVPGGRYPLPSTALMTALTAQAAGVPEIIIVSPQLPDAVLFAGHLAGVRQFWRMGGAQAVAALAYGTQTLAPADVIVGPGNAWVTEAKRQLQGVVGIDMLAGPSEVVVIADERAHPRFVALELLAQAEHDPDARAYLLTDSLSLAQAVAALLPECVAELDLPAFVSQSLSRSALLCLDSLAECARVCNQLAPEHVSVQTANPDAVAAQLDAYGALFLGDVTTVAYGDYVAGPNHTLPTGRRARFSGGLTPMTFLRPQSWARLAADGAPLVSAHTDALASLEGLAAHAAAARARC